jgi:dGTPase
LNHEGDLFRTRLTHSLEVAQLGRSIARTLQLNEDLVEAISLAHDLGHTPFGHAGQDALNDCMRAHGGFEHNLQSLRVVDQLEESYPQFNGINLSFETREGILKHCSLANAGALEAREPGGVGRRFVDGTLPSLEAQLCNLADEIAYNAHDIDDGVRSGLITMEQLQDVPLFDNPLRQVVLEFPELGARKNDRRLLFETIRRMLSAQVYDLIDVSQRVLTEAAPLSADAVRVSGVQLAFSGETRQLSGQLKQFLFRNLYRHPQVMQTTTVAKQIVRDLFEAYLSAPSELSADFALHCETDGSADSAARVVADYIAGMTDRFAAREHARLTGQHLFA